jgi:hypothetical protein
MPKNSFILIEFVDGQAKFDIRTDTPDEVIVALLGLEGYLAQTTGLGATEIRELMDDEKDHVVVTPKAPIEDVTDVEIE